MCVCNLCHTPGSKKHTNSSRLRPIFPFHFHISTQGKISNCENAAVTTQHSDDEWLANAVCDDSFILGKVSRDAKIYKVDEYHQNMSLYWVFSLCVNADLFIQNIKFIINIHRMWKLWEYKLIWKLNANCISFCTNNKRSMTIAYICMFVCGICTARHTKQHLNAKRRRT